jgi:hypothetical protein
VIVTPVPTPALELLEDELELLLEEVPVPTDELELLDEELELLLEEEGAVTVSVTKTIGVAV